MGNQQVCTLFLNSSFGLYEKLINFRGKSISLCDHIRQSEAAACIPSPIRKSHLLPLTSVTSV